MAKVIATLAGLLGMAKVIATLVQLTAPTRVREGIVIKRNKRFVV
jgi:hypothetical protein